MGLSRFIITESDIIVEGVRAPYGATYYSYLAHLRLSLFSASEFQHPREPTQHTMGWVPTSWASVSLALIGISAGSLVYVVAQVVHRLWFSPIAAFPGPKLAAVSFW